MPALVITLADWLHTLSPFAVRFTESFGPRWYGLSYLAGFVVAYLVLRWLAGRGLTTIPRERAADVILAIVVGTLIGGRLGYVLVYERDLLIQFTWSPPWWGLLAIQKGGMASHGGMAGLVCAAWWVSRGFKDRPAQAGEPLSPGRTGKSPFLHVMDILGLLSPAGIFFGRLANFVNGELLGGVVAAPGEPGPWWAVRFPQELRAWHGIGNRDNRSHAPELLPSQQSALKDLIDSTLTPGDLVLPVREQWHAGLDRVLEAPARHAATLRTLVSARHPPARAHSRCQHGQ